MPSMALHPRHNSSFCMQHCCLIWIHVSKSNILLLEFNIAHWQFNLHISNTIHMYHSFGSWFVCFICVASQSLFYFVVNERPFFKSNFPSLTCDILLFHCDIDAWCECYGAEGDMLAAQCNILVWTLNFALDWADLEMVAAVPKLVDSKYRKIRAYTLGWYSFI